MSIGYNQNDYLPGVSLMVGKSNFDILILQNRADNNDMASAMWRDSQ